jgi:hypothetical protein
MLGGMAGGGMGFLFDPKVQPRAKQRLGEIMSATRKRLEGGVPFAMEPVVYDFRINEHGSVAELRTAGAALMPPAYYTLRVPALLRQEQRSLTAAQRAELERFGDACRHDQALSGMTAELIDHLLPQSQDGAGTAPRGLRALLDELGFDAAHHEKIRGELRAGRIGLSQNRLPVSSRIEDVRADEIHDARVELPARLRQLGEQALAEGALAVVSLAGGAGSRWTHGAGVVKALNPFAKLAGRHRTFVEVHLAKSRRAARAFGAAPPHIFTTSYMTHAPMAAQFEREANFGYEGPVRLSPGRSVGLRLIPMARDLRFAWEEMPQQQLDVQKQKVLESLRASLIQWAERTGEGSDYTDNLPLQCLHPVGHWYEIPNLLRNGVLRGLLDERPALRYLLLHNIDTLGADIDPALFGLHIESESALTVEVIARWLDDRGGGLARIDGRVRLIEGLALPAEEVEFDLSWYNTGTMWIDIDRMLAAFGLTRAGLADEAKVAASVRALAARMPTYITLKDVKKRWGRGQEDVFPVTQFEKLWGDMTALAELPCCYAAVPRRRGQQLKEVAQLDGWWRDGSAAWLETRCDFGA